MLTKLSSMESADYLVRQAGFLANLDSSDFALKLLNLKKAQERDLLFTWQNLSD